MLMRPVSAVRHIQHGQYFLFTKMLFSPKDFKSNYANNQTSLLRNWERNDGAIIGNPAPLRQLIFANLNVLYTTKQLVHLQK